MIDHATSARTVLLARLRHKADQQLRPVHVVEKRIDWTRGLLAALALVVLFAWSQERDRADFALIASENANATAATWRARAEQSETTAAVRLVPDGRGFRCVHFHIQREWIAAVASKCKELGGLLTAARATP